MSYILEYVNTKDNEYDYDKVFANYIELMAFVDQHHSDYTSYQITVVRNSALVDD